MPILTVYKTLSQIALREFSDIVIHAQVMSLPRRTLLDTLK